MTERDPQAELTKLRAEVEEIHREMLTKADALRTTLHRVSLAHIEDMVVCRMVLRTYGQILEGILDLLCDSPEVRAKKAAEKTVSAP